MNYRSDMPHCPTCAKAATHYDCVWDYLHCVEGHTWDGPLNNPALEGSTLPQSHSTFPEFDGETGQRIHRPNVLDPCMADQAVLDAYLDDPNVSNTVAARIYVVLVRHGWAVDTLSVTWSHPDMNDDIGRFSWGACKITRQWLHENTR